ncbi:phage tail spike protein [Ornithinibacillus bavariensis]|uniref:phage tail spike protein n=1 Tax=Ornithinibacillus bavariensis TaxID=545502 RepID=UPI000EE0950C|nr:lysin [Ornithinibacillus sp.]
MYLVTIYDGPNDNVGTVIHSPYPSGIKLSSGQIKLVIRGISDMSFVINPTNPAWGKIKPLKTLIEVVDIKRNKKIFDGRVLKPTEKMSSDGMFSIQYACESKLAYLNDSNQRHGEYHNMTVRDFFQVIIDNHNRQVEPHKRFKVGNVTVTNSNDNVYRYLGYDKTFDSINDKLIDRLGGFLFLREESDGMYLDYLESVGELKETPIRLRTNLKNMQREIDPLDVITRLIPLGTRIESEDENAADISQARLTIASVNGGIDYLDDLELQEEFGIVEGEVIFDDVTQPNILKTRGQQFLNSQKASKTSYDVNPVDVSLIDSSFEAFECGNWHRIINPVFEIDEPLQIIEQTIDINVPQNASLTIGEKYKTLTQYQIEANKKTKSVAQLEQTVASQSQTISSLKTELTQIDTSVSDIQQALEDSDFPALEDAIENLNQAVDNLIAAVEDIPVYEVATPTKDGLMSAVDKRKLDLISVINPIDLDTLVARVEALENARI